MKLFISWSGERSRLFAAALKEWLPLVLHYVDPWLSEADIEAGQRWADAVAKELEASKFGVLCITRENLNSPWVLFEAGALAKSLDGARVTPLLFGIEFSEISGPLAQFQAKKLEKKGVLELVQSLNQNAAQPVAEERYKQLFEALWPELEKKVSGIPSAPAAARHTRSQSEVLEELVEAVRAMETRVRETPEESRSLRRKSVPHPLMLRELAELVSDRPGDPVGILIVASYFREDVPWLYELGLEAYRAIRSGNNVEPKKSLKSFNKALEMTLNGPFQEISGASRYGNSRELEFIFHDMMRRQMAFLESGKAGKDGE